MKITLDTSLPVKNTEGWDGDAARQRILRWAGYDQSDDEEARAAAIERASRLFLFRREESESAGDLVAPCGDVEDGSPFLDSSGMRYALAAVNGARGGIDAPRELLDEARQILMRLLGIDEQKSLVEIKKTDDGRVIARGYAVVWGGEDLYGEQFTPETDFGEQWFKLDSPPVLYEHGLHPKVGFSVLGKVVSLSRDEIGLLIEAELDRHNEYLALVEELAKHKALGLSTGSAGHLVERQNKTITRWPIVEVSLTPTPAEPRTLGVEVIEQIRSLVREPQESERMRHADACASEATGAQEGHSRLDVSQQKKGVNMTPVLIEQQKRESFSQFIRALAARDESALRALGAQTGSQGGYLVPEVFLDELFGAMQQSSIFLQRAFVVNAAGTIRQPVVDVSLGGADTYAWFGGIKFSWTTENTAIPETEPKFKQYTLRGLTLSGITRVSNRLLQSANVDTQLRNMFASAMAAYLDYYFVNGNGTGQPLGVLNAPALVTVTRENANNVTAADLAKMYARLPSGSAGGAVWLIHPTVMEKLAQLSVGNAPVWFADFRQGAAGTLFGLPIIFTETVKPLGTPKDVVLCDMRAYAVQLANNIEIAVSEHAYFEFDQTAYRVTAYADGQPRVADKAKWIGTNTETSPFIALN